MSQTYNMNEAVRQFRYKIVKGALEIHDGNLAQSAKYVGLSYATFYRWVDVLGLDSFGKELRQNRHDVRVALITGVLRSAALVSIYMVLWSLSIGTIN